MIQQRSAGRTFLKRRGAQVFQPKCAAGIASMGGKAAWLGIQQLQCVRGLSVHGLQRFVLELTCVGI